MLVPTHELCMQVFEILQKLLHRFHWIVPGYLMGGENRSKEKARLRKGGRICLLIILVYLWCLFRATQSDSIYDREDDPLMGIIFS